MSTNIKKTQQFLYFQSKAKHYDNIKNIKPSVRSFRDQMPSPRPRPHSLLKEYDEVKNNQCLVNNILEIRHSGKSRVGVTAAYSRYNDFDVGRLSKHGTFRETQRYQSIEHDNLMLGQKILRMKPSVGTVNQWNANFENMKSRQKIASKLTEKKNLSIYSRNQFVPEYFRTFMDRDGSTVAIREKIFQLPKVIAQNYNDPTKIDRKQFKLDLDFRNIIKDTSGQLKYPVP